MTVLRQHRLQRFEQVRFAAVERCGRSSIIAEPQG